MQYLKGDLIKLAIAGKFDVICHGCNCFNTMGSGIAKQIALHYPGAYTIDLDTCKGDRNKLGTFTYASYAPIVCNLYTQYDYGRDGKDRFEYTAFDLILEKLAAKWPNASFGFNKIGSGLAGGDWSKIENSLINFENNLSEEFGTVNVVQL